MHDRPRRRNAPVPDNRCGGDVRLGVHRGQETGTQAAKRVGHLQPRPIAGDRHDDVHGLYGEHALQHAHVTEDRYPPHLPRQGAVGVVVESEHPIPEPTREQDVQSYPSVPAGPDDRHSHLFVEVDTLYIDFWVRCRSGCFGLSYLNLLPVTPRKNLAGYSWQFSTLAGLLRL